MSRRAKWNLALGIAGVAYVASVLAVGLSSPFFSFLFIALAANELRAAHAKR